MNIGDTANFALNAEALIRFSSLNNLIDHLDDESFAILAELFSIDNGNIASQRGYIKNIIVPKLYVHNKQIINDFSEIIENIDIIENQLKLPIMFNQRFLNKSFYTVQAISNMAENITITISGQNKNKLTYAKIIPEGLLSFKDYNRGVNRRKMSKIMFYDIS